MKSDKFIHLNYSEKSNLVPLFQETFEYYDSLFEGKFSPSQVVRIIEVVEKVRGCGAHYNVLDQEINELLKEAPRHLVRIVNDFHSGPRKRSVIDLIRNKKKDVQHELLLSQAMSILADLRAFTNTIYDQILVKINDSRIIDFNNFFSPDASNKEKVKRLLLEAIKHIEEEKSLSAKAKLKLSKSLLEIIKEIESPTTDWTDFFGKLRQVTAILGAIGAMTGGTCAAITSANNKLIEASEEIDKTSIQLNHKNVREIFNVQDTNLLDSQNPHLIKMLDSSK